MAGSFCTLLAAEAAKAHGVAEHVHLETLPTVRRLVPSFTAVSTTLRSKATATR